MTRPEWKLRRLDQDLVAGLVRSESVPEVVARLLVARGFSDPAAAREHLTPALTRLHDPFLLPGMRAATDRLQRAIAEGETILVHGDYDVDGVTGTSLLVRLFDLLGAKVEWHIPNRFTDGYSFGQHSIDRAKATGATVVISVDNGTSAAETIDALLEIGVETIVTDHHEPPRGALPKATAIVNPKLTDSTYPFRELCGGAVAFKLAWGLCQAITGETRVRPDLREFLVDAMSYVAIATVCDVVPLIDENRILGRYGLRALQNTKSPGLRAMLKVAGLDDGRRLVGDDVGFQIGPRINASGRLGTAQSAVELLLAKSDEIATSAAQRLDDLNIKRKEIERELLVEARAAAAEFADAQRWPVMLLAGQGWHQGVIGIIAARLVEEYGRPAIVIGLDGDTGRGSARSVAGFSVLDAMHGGAEHMIKYGGHDQAAGCEVNASSIDALREAICSHARALLAGGEYPTEHLVIDAEVPLESMTPALMNEIDRLEPFGEANESPILSSSNLRLAEPARRIGQDESHLMMRVRRGSQVLKALAFGMGSRADELAMGKDVHVVYTPRWNTFRGTTQLELLVLDFRVGDPARPVSG